MTSEYIAQMAPMLVIAAVMVAWLAQIPSTARGYGFLPDMAISFVGSGLAGTLLWAATAADGMVGMFVIGSVGAVLAIIAQRGLWRSLPS